MLWHILADFTCASPPAPPNCNLQGVLKLLQGRGISVRVATRHLAAEEAPESYKVRKSACRIGSCLPAGAGVAHCWGLRGLTAWHCLSHCFSPRFRAVRRRMWMLWWRPAMQQASARRQALLLLNGSAAHSHPVFVCGKAAVMLLDSLQCPAPSSRAVTCICANACDTAVLLSEHKSPCSAARRWSACAPSPSSRAEAGLGQQAVHDPAGL